jgi:hypothetical protein
MLAHKYKTKIKVTNVLAYLDPMPNILKLCLPSALMCRQNKLGYFTLGDDFSLV